MRFENENLPKFLADFDVPSAKSVILAIAQAGKSVARYLVESELKYNYVNTNRVNVSGDVVQAADIFANDRLIHNIAQTGKSLAIASEEEREFIVPKQAPGVGEYVVFFDPLDGSSNIDVNVSIGTIFSLIPVKRTASAKTEADFLRPGKEIVCAGYIVYGHSTVLVLASSGGVNMFLLDANREEFYLFKEVSKHGNANIYSINEASSKDWFDSDDRWIKSLKSGYYGTYTARYIGSLVADFHRGLLKGGIFAYPASKRNPQGKLRLLYECAPLAYIAKQAHATASDGKTSILDIQPKTLHQRSPLYIGDKEQVALAISFQKS